MHKMDWKRHKLSMTLSKVKPLQIGVAKATGSNRRPKGQKEVENIEIEKTMCDAVAEAWSAIRAW